MAKNVLFLLHGIGDHVEGWSKPTQTILKNEFKVYMKHSGKSSKLTDELEFVEITYNDIFDSVWDKWVELSKSLEHVGNAKLPQPLRTINSLLGEADSDGSQARNNTAIGYAADAVLYYAFKLVRRLVLFRVMSIIAQTVAKRRKTHPSTQFGVLGHSLGTAVAHDAIHVLGTTSWNANKWNSTAKKAIDNAENAFLNNQANGLTNDQNDMLRNLRKTQGASGFSPGKFQYASILMIANVTPILARQGGGPYRSIVRPNPSSLSSTIRGASDHYVSVCHSLDPACKVKPFDEKKIKEAERRVASINIGHLHDINVHSLTHYMSNPKTHRWVFKHLCKSFGDRESRYVDRRFSEELKIDQDPDYFPRTAGRFSEDKIIEELQKRAGEKFNKILEKLK